MKTATFVKQLDGTGKGKVYLLSEPLEGFEYVWVSAATTYSGPETYIFGSDSEGNVENWGELEGSYRGGLNHEKALCGAGYRVIKARS